MVVTAEVQPLYRYEDTSKDVSKWQPIVKANREAPTLRFSDGREELPGSSTAALAATHQPASQMEREIAGATPGLKAAWLGHVLHQREQLSACNRKQSLLQHNSLQRTAGLQLQLEQSFLRGCLVWTVILQQTRAAAMRNRCLSAALALTLCWADL